MRQITLTIAPGKTQTVQVTGNSFFVSRIAPGAQPVTIKTLPSGGTSNYLSGDGYDGEQFTSLAITPQGQPFSTSTLGGVLSGVTSNDCVIQLTVADTFATRNLYTSPQETFPITQGLNVISADNSCYYQPTETVLSNGATARQHQVTIQNTGQASGTLYSVSTNLWVVNTAARTFFLDLAGTLQWNYNGAFMGLLTAGQSITLDTSAQIGVVNMGVNSLPVGATYNGSGAYSFAITAQTDYFLIASGSENPAGYWSLTNIGPFNKASSFNSGTHTTLYLSGLPSTSVGLYITKYLPVLFSYTQNSVLTPQPATN
jgi:hypothetical protein